MANTFLQISKDIKAKQFQPLYLLHGEESWYIDELVALLEEHVLTEAEKGFNQMVFYGRDTEAQSVIDAATRYPMFAEKQLVILKEAQQFTGFDRLEKYVSKPLASTVLVIAHKFKNFDKRKKIYKAFDKNGVAFKSEKLKERQLAGWMQERIKKAGFSIKPIAIQILEEYLGNDLAKIESEFQKLFLNIPAGHEIDLKDIEKHIGISREYNFFELNNALLRKEVVKANRIVNYFIANPKQGPMVLINSSLGKLFSKVYLAHFNKGKDNKSLAASLGVSPYFVRDYIDATSYYSVPKLERIFSYLLQSELKSKGVDSTSRTSHGEVMREMVYKILH